MWAGISHLPTGRQVTLSLLALWFLSQERLAIGKKNAGGDSTAGAGDHDAAVASSGPHGVPDRPRGHRRAGSQRTSENLPLALTYGPVPAAAQSRRVRLKRLQ